ncbi:MAG: aldehyde dehydrogenase [Tannerellaceae bacterium]|jgi:lactaldehyde dehydrogenase/glycolaldehyde dehydrogenase|nr:aldehyde dehydrogenase [Tannerellaceae bacterium]
MNTLKQFINGQFIDALSGRQLEVEDPFEGKIIGLAPDGDASDADAALRAAAAAQPSWAKKSAPERASYLRAMAAQIRANRVELAQTLAREQAKVMPLAQVEIDFTADYFEYYAGWARIYEGEIIQSDRPNENIFLFRKPIGVVAGICPWNFPFFVMARKVAPSLLAGCTAVIKPSSLTPLTTFAFAGMVEATGLPAGALNFVSGRGSTLGDALVRHELTDMVSLTGSVEAGRDIIRASADRITKVSLELGGKAPAIVFKDADIDLAVKAIVDSRVIFGGQVCNCAERAYVHASVFDEFVEKISLAMSKVSYGSPFAEPAPQMSSLIDSRQLDKVEAMVERAIAEGAEVVTGGCRAEGSGYKYEPTILAGCTQQSEIVQSEVFGPVLPILPFTDYDEAIALANDSRYGLTSSVFSSNVSLVMQALKDLRFGETYVNREHFEGMQGFHAGWRQSGIGGADGKHGLMEYLQSQVAYVQY